MTEYRTGSVRRGGPRHHWSERSWLNPRRWLAVPILVGALGAVACWVGIWLQMINGGLNLWGFLALGGILLATGALAWAQSDINHLRNRRK